MELLYYIVKNQILNIFASNQDYKFNYDFNIDKNKFCKIQFINN